MFELAIGVQDGVNKDFRTSYDFMPGTLQAYLNGDLQDSWVTETGLRTFEVADAPATKDVVKVRYDAR